MTDAKSYPYVTHLDIKFPSLDLIDVEALAKSVTDQWYNQTLCSVNDSVVRLGVLKGEYHWHKRDNDDEFFFVLSGRFIVDLEERFGRSSAWSRLRRSKRSDALYARVRTKRDPHGGDCRDSFRRAMLRNLRPSEAYPERGSF